MVTASDNSLHPSDVHPDLTTERLRAIGMVIKETALDCLDDHAPDKGDDNWVFGVKFLARLISRLNRFAKQNPWFQIIDASRHYVFQIGAVPSRIYRGTISKPRPNMAQPTPVEQQQQVLGFFEHNYVWRFIVMVDPVSGAFEGVHFTQVEYYNKVWHVGMSWPVPIDGYISAVTSLSDLVRDAVEIEKPQPPPLRSDIAAETENLPTKRVKTS